MKSTAKLITNWIVEKVKGAKAKGVVLGLSGGVDSSVVAVLAKRALDDKVLGLIMPCHSDKQDAEHAKLVAKKFRIKTKCIDLTPIYDSLIKISPKGGRIAKGNLKARLRMLTLYYFANNYGYLVLGTNDKSERVTGYFTRYGDGGVDLEPMGDLYKTQVIELAKELRIPKEIVEKPPSAGLWYNQRNEDELGMKYDELDEILHCLLDLKMKPEEISKKLSVSLNEVKRIIALIRKNEFKSRMPPICKL